MMKKYTEQYLEELSGLIEEGKKIADLAQPTIKDSYLSTIREGDQLQSWLIRSENVVLLIFGENSFQYKKYQKLEAKKTYYPSTVREIYGLLDGCKLHLEGGFIVGLESLLLRDTFGSLLKDAEELNAKNHTRSAAVYCRVVVENTLKKLASQHGINPKQPASTLNKALRDKEFFDDVTHSKIKTCLLIGNKAAHEESFEHKPNEVEQMIRDITNFINTQLGEALHDH